MLTLALVFLGLRVRVLPRWCGTRVRFCSIRLAFLACIGPPNPITAFRLDDRLRHVALVCDTFKFRN